jgi:hypothetical protein
MSASTQNTPPGPGVDASGQAVIDPTKNVLDLVTAETRRQDDLREMDGKHVRDVMSMRATYDEKLRLAESARIDAIRAVDVGAVAAAAQSAESRATTLATQVATQADAVRVGLAAALEPIQRDIADLRRVQYEAAGGKETSKERGASLGVWVGLAIAGVFGFLSFLVALAGLIFALTR